MENAIVEDIKRYLQHLSYKGVTCKIEGSGIVISPLSDISVISNV